jgi:hypothetical protein
VKEEKEGAVGKRTKIPESDNNLDPSHKGDAGGVMNTSTQWVGAYPTKCRVDRVLQRARKTDISMEVEVDTANGLHPNVGTDKDRCSRGVERGRNRRCSASTRRGAQREVQEWRRSGDVGKLGLSAGGLRLIGEQPQPSLSCKRTGH